MPYELITERNMSEGMHVLIVYINDITEGLFLKILLLSIWCIVAFGLYFAQKRGTGEGDFPMAVAVAGFVTAVTTFLLRLIEGLVDGLTFLIVLVIAVISIIWFFFSKD